VARDRKRAKQRRDRRRAAPQRSTSAAGDHASGIPPTQPTRADVPGALDHASSDADEFDAALVRGAEGVAGPSEASLEDLEAESEDELGLSPESPAPGTERGRRDGAGGLAAEREHAEAAPHRGRGRAIAFLQASWAELQRVQWPDRRQVTQATAVVLGFVIVAGAYLGLADYVAKEIVETVL
jgi:preprotein translocase subunit SecE